MLSRRTFAASTLGTLLSGCVGTRELRGSYDLPTFEALVRQIKYDVGSYVFAHQDDKTLPAPVGEAPSAEEMAVYQAKLKSSAFRRAPPSEKCPGQVDIAIAKIKLTVTTVSEGKTTGSFGLKVPIGLVTVGPSASGSRTFNNTLTTTLEIFPSEGRLDHEPQPVPEFSGRPIMETLEALKSDLVKTSDTLPCFNFGKSDNKTNSVKWGFTIARSQTVGAKFELLIFSLGAEASATHSVANTIEAFFVPTGEGFG